jgi:hypothetical protein
MHVLPGRSGFDSRPDPYDDLNMGWDKDMDAPNGLKVIAPDQYTGLTSKHMDMIMSFLVQKNINLEGS